MLPNLHRARIARPLTLLSTALLPVLLASAATAADRFVAPGGTDAANSCLDAGLPCGTLAHALAEASDGDTIKMTAGRYGGTSTIEASLVVLVSGGWSDDFSTRDVDANPSILDGRKTRAVMEIDAGATEVVDVTLDGLTVRRGSSFGGAILARANDGADVALTLHDTTFRKNRSGNVGGLFAIADVGSTLALTVDDSSFLLNRSGVAGALRLLCSGNSTATLRITGSVFARNQGVLGAAILAEDAGGTVDVVVDSSAFTRNKARSTGGGMWIHGTNSLVASVVNSTFTKNKAAQGGAIYASNAVSLALTNATLTKNKSSGSRRFGPPLRGGGVMFVSPMAASLQLLNSIVWGNRAKEGGDVFAIGSGGSLVVDGSHNDLHDIILSGATFNDLGGNIDAAPAFETAGYFLRNAPGSPVIDTGTCTGAPTVDFENDPRPSGADCDMGADELAP